MEQNQSELICIGKKKAINICGSEDCHDNGLMCSNEDCQCQCDKHLRCPFFKIKTILNDLKNNSLNNEEQKSLETVENIFTQQIEQLAIYRQQTRIKKHTLGLKENSLKVFTLINEKHLQELTGQLIHKTIKEFKTPQEKYSLKSHLQILKFWQEKKNQFKNFCQTIKSFSIPNNISQNYPTCSNNSNQCPKSPTKNSTNLSPQSPPKNIPSKPSNNANNSSQIIQTNSVITTVKSKIIDNFEQFIKWIGRKIVNMKILYRASEDNFSVQAFHRKCDKIKNTLIIIKTDFNKIIGGFTNLTWSSAKNNFATDTENKTFLFSYTNKEKYFMTNQTQHLYAIYCEEQFGPTFGRGHDLHICNFANLVKQSFCYFPFSYNNGLYMKSQQAFTAISGVQNGYKFLIKQWQVFEAIMED